MSSRRREREYALQALYQCDTLENFSLECMELYFSTFFDGSMEEVDSSMFAEQISDTSKFDFTRKLVSEVVANLSAVDNLIGAASKNWSVNRMSRVDRNILRIGTFEINYLSDIPISVSINEAIEVAKRFGSDDSPMFVNGVLDKVAEMAKNAVSSGSTLPAESAMPAEIMPAEIKKVINE